MSLICYNFSIKYKVRTYDEKRFRHIQRYTNTACRQMAARGCCKVVMCSYLDAIGMLCYV